MHGAAQLLTNTLLERKAKNWAQKMAAADREFLDVNSPHGQLTFSGRKNMRQIQNSSMSQISTLNFKCPKYVDLKRWTTLTINFPNIFECLL